MLCPHGAETSYRVILPDCTYECLTPFSCVLMSITGKMLGALDGLRVAMIVCSPISGGYAGSALYVRREYFIYA